MPLKLFNTLTRKKEDFKPIKKGEVLIYSCGPTVYWYQHIGNLRTYVFSDLLKRILLYDGFKVKHVMNVTDVGHLTSDADEGEDKIEKAAKQEGKSAEEIANYYWKIFREDFKKLNIIEPDIWCKATEHIKEQIELVKTLEKKGYTYETSDGIYFDTSKFKDYGKLALLKAEGLKAGKRVAVGEKRNKTDFALWKFSEKPGVRQQEWNPRKFGAEWKTGFPGWHIECSAMSSKYLGKQFDIHTGGEDHIPIHHTNEIAQSESAFGKKPWVRFWLHGSFLTFRGEKVSKSKGGLYTVSELEEKGFAPLTYRYFCLTGHYRSQLEFSLENLESAKNSLQRLKNIISGLKDDGKTNKKYLDEFDEKINNDMDIPGALSVMWNMLRDENATGKYLTVKKMDGIFGLDILKKVETQELPREVIELIKRREMARKIGDFKAGDEIRKRILEEFGIVIEDSKEGVKWRKA
jgi:cysteinyl-tRNA synthetase